MYKTDKLEIEKVQRRATKLIPELRELSYPDRLRRLNLTTLEYRRQRTDIIQVFRIFKKIDRIPYDQFFTRNTNKTKGHSHKLSKFRPDSRQRENSFSIRVINAWNNLDQSTINCLKIEDNTNALNNFKNCIEREWRNCPFEYDFFMMH